MTTDTTLAPTPGPWTVYNNRVCVWVYAPDGKPVCKVDDAVRIEARANAAFIVRACNAHADMLAALRVCRDAERERRAKLLPGAPATTYTESRMAMIDAAIARAEGR